MYRKEVDVYKDVFNINYCRIVVNYINTKTYVGECLLSDREMEDVHHL